MPSFGVAFEVPDPFGSFLHDRRVQFGDPTASIMPPHVTLLPPTTVRGDRVDRVVSHLNDVGADTEPFPVVLAGTDTFRPVTPTVFVPLTVGGDACHNLELLVRSGPLRRRLTFAYHPHVTVGFELPDPELDRLAAALAGFSASFWVREFSLYEPADDGAWQPVANFRLGGS